MRIHALSTDKGGCHYYRLRVPLTELRRHGHETSWGTGITAEELSSSHVLIGQFLNGEHDLAGWESIARSPRRPLLVYETDDDLFTIDEIITREVSRRKVLWGEPETQARVLRFIELADLVTVSTPELARRMAGMHPHIEVLPNSIPHWLLDKPIAPEPLEFTIGYTCSTSHLLDVRAHIDTLEGWMGPRRARMLWHGPSSIAQAKYPDKHATIPWQGDVNHYLNTTGAFHVGIAPLGAYKFNGAKSGIKADEYAAWGRPVIATDAEQYRAVVVNGVTGFLCNDSVAWQSALSSLYLSTHVRRKMGRAAREHVAERTIRSTAHMWTEAYERALDDKSR